MKLTRTTQINIDSAFPGPPGKPTISTAADSHTSISDCSDGHDDPIHDEQYIMSQQVATSLASRTESRVQGFLDKSDWVRKNSKLAQLPCLSSADFEMGKILAHGGFAYIHDITAIHNQVMEGADEEEQPRHYVIKHLKPELALNQSKLRSGAKDISSEIHVLSALDHKHIIKLRAVSPGFISGLAETCRVDSLFMVLDRLDQTLLHRIPHWRREGICKQALSLDKLNKCPSTLQLFQERVRAAQQIASALAYLHQRRIVHRDIKPGNVGWVDGCLKLFDFGLAVELPASDDPNATFAIGNAGTVRYSAPEVLKKKESNYKAETYSLSIMTWEMISLSKPFRCLNEDEVKETVAQIGSRPTIPRCWPTALRNLLKKGWSKSQKARPTMAEMEAALDKIASTDFHKRSMFAMP